MLPESADRINVCDLALPPTTTVPVRTRKLRDCAKPPAFNWLLRAVKSAIEPVFSTNEPLRFPGAALPSNRPWLVKEPVAGLAACAPAVTEIAPASPPAAIPDVPRKPLTLIVVPG